MDAIRPLEGPAAAALASNSPASQNGTSFAARKFEAAFLAEMLRHAGFARPPSSGGGGAGERHMSGFLVEQVAADIARHRPLGIAAMIEAALARRAP